MIRHRLAGLLCLSLTFLSGSGGGASEKVGSKSSPARTVKFVGFDCSPPLVDALREGQLQGVVVQNPFRMGRDSVNAVVAALEKKPVERKVSTGEILVTPENMN